MGLRGRNANPQPVPHNGRQGRYNARTTAGNDSMPNRLAKALTALLLATAILGGCGQKGPLYLPGDQDRSQTSNR